VTSGTSLTAAAASIVGRHTQAASLESTSATTTYHRKTVDGVGVFYREAGPNDAPTIVLLHGFPSSSREFDTLIPLLATRYHLIAPDFPGFGQSESPLPSSYVYTFDNLAKTINELLEQLDINKYAFYLHDYGGPVGFRIITAHPERLQALIIQNANAYKEGLGAKWAAIAQYWADPNAHPEVFDAFVSLTATEQRHTLGTSHPERYNPDIWTDEYAHLSRPGQGEIQADLLYDYRTNVASYPAWQAWLRDHRPPVLVVWGRNDPSFIAPGAEASSAIFRTPKSTCSTPATSPWTRRTTRSRVSFLRSWLNIPSDRSVDYSTRLSTLYPQVQIGVLHEPGTNRTENL
jgi:pimeloyl-ACP methyl ester carboxylesterase